VNSLNFINIKFFAEGSDSLKQIKKEEEIPQGQIIFLNLRDFFKARHSRKFRKILDSAALIIPVSRHYTRASSYIGKELQSIKPYQAMMILMNSDLHKSNSIFFLGDNDKNLLKAEQNIKSTFPMMHIVGRHNLTFDKSREKDILEAIKKTNPDILLIGKCKFNSLKWLSNNQNLFLSKNFIISSDILRIFSGKIKKIPSEFPVKKGLNYIINMIYLYLTVFFYKLFKK